MPLPVPPKTRVVLMVTNRDDSGRITKQRIKYAEKLKPGLWREYEETREYPPPSLK